MEIFILGLMVFPFGLMAYAGYSLYGSSLNLWFTRAYREYAIKAEDNRKESVLKIEEIRPVSESITPTSIVETPTTTNGVVEAAELPSPAGTVIFVGVGVLEDALPTIPAKKKVSRKKSTSPSVKSAKKPKVSGSSKITVPARPVAKAKVS